MFKSIRVIKTVELLLLLIYAVLLFIVISHHEPWFDEAQAWLLARDSTVGQLIFNNLRYEGSPGLWHLILMLPAKLGLSYSFLKLVAFLAAVAGMFIFLTRSPFPLWLKVVFPFTYYAFYQYGVVSRSYVLIPLLLFLIIATYKTRFERTSRFFLLLILLSQVSLHGTIISFAYYLIFIIDAYKKVENLPGKQQKKIVSWVLSYLVVLLFTVYLLLPPRDGVIPRFFDYNIVNIYKKGALIINSFISEIPFISIPVLILSLFWFQRRKVLLEFLVPFLFLMALFTVKYYNVWHEGMLFLVWIAGIWLGYGSRQDDRKLDKSKVSWFDALVMVVLLIHTSWAIRTSLYDLRYNYSAARDVASYIKEHGLEKSDIFIYDNYMISILPYFEENIFSNLNEGKQPSYRIWKKKYLIRSNEVFDHDHDLVLFSHRIRKTPCDRLSGLYHQDYEFVEKVDSGIFWKTGLYEKNSISIYRRKDQP